MDGIGKELKPPRRAAFPLGLKGICVEAWLKLEAAALPKPLS